MTRSGITAAGNYIVDRVKIVDRYPEQDTLANILSESVGNGGGAFNVLVDLSRLGFGHPLRAMGFVGADADGDWIRRTCSAHQIDTASLLSCDAPTSYTDVMTVESTGRRTFFHQRGSNALFGSQPIDLGFGSSKILYLGYILLLDALDAPDLEYGTRAARLLAEASRTGLKTAIDVVSEDGDRFERIIQPALPHVDWCFLNEFEAERTTGIPIRRDGVLDRSALERAGVRLLELGVHEAVFLHAPEGALAVSADGERIWQGAVRLPSDRIVGAVGAGDAFAAGVLYGLHDGADLSICLEYGVYAAAASLTHASASDGVIPLSDCVEMGRRFGYRN